MRARTYAQSVMSVVLLFAAVSFALRSAVAGAPTWWATRGVLDTSANRVTNDYAPATLGQLKWMAAQARNEFDAQLPGGASTAVVAMLAAFPTNSYYAPATLGQGKAVAKPFYDQLAVPGAPYAYPWTGTNANDFAPLLLGQLKNLFAIELGDTDADGMPDWWEAQFGLTDSLADADGDGLANLAEYTRHTNPRVADSDGDGYADGLEAAEDSSPTSAGSLPSTAILQVYNTRER